MELLIRSFPKYVAVADLPLGSDAQKLDVARALIEEKLVFMR